MLTPSRETRALENQPTLFPRPERQVTQWRYMAICSCVCVAYLIFEIVNHSRAVLPYRGPFFILKFE
jgi:hypothetical protein